MKKHKSYINGYEENFEKLAEEIGDLRYDSLEKFLYLLSEKLSKDSFADASRNRVKLSKLLNISSSQIKLASKAINTAWIICEPHMKDYE